MNEQEALSNLIPPGQKRPGKMRGGVLQIWVTRACDQSCCACTQGGNLRGTSGFITPTQFEQACRSLKDYWGVVGMFGGNPALHPEFGLLCQIMMNYIPREQRGIWCNHPRGKGEIMRGVFNPAVSNLNVHLNRQAYYEFKRDWPECRPVGLIVDSRHSTPYIALKDIEPDEERRWDLIADCDINRHWSAMICVVRCQLKGYFCEIAGAQAILHQNDNLWPDLGVPIEPGWWKQKMVGRFADQARYYCHRCGIPLRLYGSLSQDQEQPEMVSPTHAPIYSPRNSQRKVRVVTSKDSLNEAEPRRVRKTTDYLGNANQ